MGGPGEGPGEMHFSVEVVWSSYSHHLTRIMLLMTMGLGLFKVRGTLFVDQHGTCGAQMK